MQAAACEAQAGLTASDDNQRVKVAAEGGIGAIVGAMQRQPRANVQAAACRALWYLTINPDNKVKVAAEGGVGAIVSALKNHPADAKVQEEGCGALRSLAYNNADNQVRIAAEGGVGAIVSAMQHHPTHAKIQETACVALYNLTFNSANKAKAKSAGAEDAVKRAMALQDATANTKEWGQIVLDRLKNV